MPKFCTKCGSLVEEELKFCPKCGMQLTEPPGPAQAPTLTASAPTPAVAPATQKKSSPVVKIILAMVGVLVLITIVLTAGMIYVGYRVKKKADEFKQTFKMDQSGKSVTIKTPGGPVTLGETKPGESPATADVPPYPGSTPTEGGGSFSVGGAGGFSGQEFETPDPVDKVVAFYKDKFGSKLVIHESADNAVLTLTTGTGMTNVTITRDAEAGKTKINISRIGK